MFAISPEALEASETRALLAEQHGGQRRPDAALAAHLAYLNRLEGFAGTSDHDLLFSKKEEVRLDWLGLLCVLCCMLLGVQQEGGSALGLVGTLVFVHAALRAVAGSARSKRRVEGT